MALITAFGLFVVAVLTAALQRILAEEIEAWSPWILRSIIRLAVRRLPESQRERERRGQRLHHRANLFDQFSCDVRCFSDNL
jgi:hypothetical protein